MENVYKTSLKRASLIKSAVCVWEQSSLKKKIGDEYTKNQIMCFDENWDDLNKKVMEQVQSTMHLPIVLKRELIYLVRSSSVKLFSWIDFVVKKLSCDVSVALDVCWSENGTIDKLKTIELIKARLPKSKTLKLFNMACYFCAEEYIYELWELLPAEAQTCHFYNRQLYKKYENHLVAYWKYRIADDLPELIRYLVIDHCRIYNLVYSVEENMFRMSVMEGFEHAAKYFWNRMDEEAKQRNLCESVDNILDKNFSLYPYNRKEEYAEIFFFLFKQMNQEEKYELYEENAAMVLNVLLSYWPLQDSFMSTLEDALGYLEPEEYADLCEVIVDKLTDDCDLGVSLQNSKFRVILHAVWRLTPDKMKQAIHTHSNSWYVLKNLLMVEDIQSMKMIINDPDLECEREELIERGKTSFSKLINTNNYKLLEEFTKEVLSEEEVKDFKEKIVKKVEVAYNLILNDRYEEADRFLNFIFDTEEERVAFKREMAYKNTYYCHKKMSTIWAECCRISKEEANNKSLEFLRWCAISEEELPHFKRHVFDFYQMQSAIDKFLIFFRGFDAIEEFLVWCMLTPSEIKEMRIRYKKILKRDIRCLYR